MRKENIRILIVLIGIFLLSISINIYIEFFSKEFSHKSFYNNIFCCIWTGSIFSIIVYIHSTWSDNKNWKMQNKQNEENLEVQKIKEGILFKNIFYDIIGNFNQDYNLYFKAESEDKYLVDAIYQLNRIVKFDCIKKQYYVVQKYFCNDEIGYFENIIKSLEDLKYEIEDIINIYRSSESFKIERYYANIEGGNEFIDRIYTILEKYSVKIGYYNNEEEYIEDYSKIFKELYKNQYQALNEFLISLKQKYNIEENIEYFSKQN